MNEAILIKMAAKVLLGCPFCGSFVEDGESVDVGVGYQQVTPDLCTNEDCGAYQLGCWEFDPQTMVQCGGWVRQLKTESK